MNLKIETILLYTHTHTIMRFQESTNLWKWEITVFSAVKRHFIFIYYFFFQRALIILLLGRCEGAEIEDTRRKLYKIKMGQVAGDGQDSG